MKPDRELLHQYAERGDEAAFAEVVRRHVNLVYASAVRLLNGDATLAEDVTQTVFTGLAHKADTSFSNQTAAGWLHNSVRFAAANAVRAEQRRRAHEQEASTMTDQTTTADNSWTQLRPLLDEAVAQLDDEERDAVLLRFFEDKSHREVGEALGLNENAARMRVERAVEKLRAQFARYGVTTTAALLTTTLGTKAASLPAPPAFAASLAGKSLTNAAATGVAGAKAATGPATWHMANVLVAAMATAVFVFFLKFDPASFAGKPMLLAAATAAPAKAVLNNSPQPRTPYIMSPTQFDGGTALFLYTGSSEDIAAAKSVMVDISRLFHAGDTATFADKYVLPEEREEVKALMEKMQHEPPDQQYRWQTLLNVFDVLQNQTPGFTISGEATFDDHLIYAGIPLEKEIPNNWISLKKQDGQWYLTPMTGISLYNSSHLK